MIGIALKIYDYLKANRRVGLLSFALLTLFLLFQVTRLQYNEDISDFLPLKGTDMKALQVYQDIAGADRLVVSFSHRDSLKASPDSIIQAIDTYVERIRQKDGHHMLHQLVDRVDMEKFSFISDFAYRNVPYFLEEPDYARIDSLLSDRDFIAERLARDKEMLMFPMGGLLSENMGRDPLNLFTPVISQLVDISPHLNYEVYDGYIFSPDMKSGLVTLSSPYGSSETEMNQRLVGLLEETAEAVEDRFPDIQVRVMGGPVIAVGNAARIKYDSALSIILSVSLIILLLGYALRNVRNLVLILVSIAWGWLFAIGSLSMVRDEISMIVVGISAVILGIAVNYPLHLIVHLSHTPDTRTALREIVSPLLVGNITTVGAFLSLVPLEAVSLSDLGLFSSFLLLGSIFFVLIYLPHLVRTDKTVRPMIFRKLSEFRVENKSWLVAAIVLLTVLFAFFVNKAGFDTDMSGINYMSEEQKADMADLSRMLSGDTGVEQLYIVSRDTTLDGALDASLVLQPQLQDIASSRKVRLSSCSKYIVSRPEQVRRLKRWEEFKREHAGELTENLCEEMSRQGFSRESFNDFFDMLAENFAVREFDYFRPFAETLFAGNLSLHEDKKDFCIVDVLTVKKNDIPDIRALVETSPDHPFVFDAGSMNSAIAETLSKDFDYIGFACGTIVFFFLWFSLGSIELAILSFIPMFISWIWILGVMGILGINFNIVNIILATFIFGQGDDYTIFMTEGASYEYAYRRKMLSSYKSSIILSALIMFIGIGSLIFARHPALFSLAQVTIIGMFSVVLMAYLFPPLIYNWLVKSHGTYRIRPVSLIPLLRYSLCKSVFILEKGMLYAAGLIMKDRPALRRCVSRLCRFNMKHLPDVDFILHNPQNEHLDTPALIICNRLSSLDIACLTAFSDKIVFVPENEDRTFLPTGCIAGTLDEVLKGQYPRDGYSLCLVSRHFDSGIAALALELNIDVLPVAIHGTDLVFSSPSVMMHAGSIHMEVLPRVSCGSFNERQRDRISEHLSLLKKKVETAVYFKALVEDRFRYKGAELYRSLCRRLKSRDCYASIVDTVADDISTVIVYNDACVEFSLFMALVHPEKQVYDIEKDEESARLLTYSAEGVVENLHVYSRTWSPDLQSRAGRHIIFRVDGSAITSVV